MKTNSNEVRDLEARLTDALEASPSPHIPADFARRVALQTSYSPQPSLAARVRFGRLTTLLALAAAVLIMLALAPFMPNHPTVSITLECAFAAEFAGMIIFLSLRPGVLR